MAGFQLPCIDFFSGLFRCPLQSCVTVTSECAAEMLHIFLSELAD
jgi:hypothetical protein